MIRPIPVYVIMFLLSVAQGFAQPLNLDFEKTGYTNTTMPWGWFTNKYNVTNVASVDSLTKYEGKYSFRITEETNTDTAASVTYQFVLDPKYLKGKKIKLSGNYKTKNVIQHGTIQLAMYEGPEYILNPGAAVNCTETKEWKNFSFSYIPAQNCLAMAIEITLQGKGTLWADNLVLSIDDETTNEILTTTPFSENEIKMLQALSMPFAGVDRSNDKNDLAFFRSVASDATIIALGESTHGTSEFFRLKNRMLTYAVEEMGVRVFALEDNMLSVGLINNYILYGQGEPASLINNLFGVWNNQEVLYMIQWMRNYNIAHPDEPIEMTGFDLQDIRLPLDSLYGFLKEQDRIVYQKADSLLPALTENWWEVFSLPEDQKLNWLTKAEECYRLVNAEKNNWLAAAETRYDSLHITYGIQYANLVRQFARNNYLPYTTFYRDSAMAANILWNLNIRPADTKIFVWAHDAHVNKGSDPVAENNYYDGLSMGTYLFTWLGEKYKPFGLSTYHGEFRAVKAYTDFTWTNAYASDSPKGSLDEGLHLLALENGMPLLFLDLQPVLKDKERYDFLLQPRPVRMNNHVSIDYAYGDLVTVPYQFAGIFFVDNTSAAAEIK